MERIQITQYKGKKIIEMDFQNFTFNDYHTVKAMIEEAEKVISAQPLNSALTLTNVTGFRFSPESVEIFGKFTEMNKPYVKHGAVVGVVGLIKVAYKAVTKFSGRDIPLFSTREEALEWLVQQD
jgi:hypothetical protein